MIIQGSYAFFQCVLFICVGYNAVCVNYRSERDPPSSSSGWLPSIVTGSSSRDRSCIHPDNRRRPPHVPCKNKKGLFQTVIGLPSKPIESLIANVTYDNLNNFNHKRSGEKSRKQKKNKTECVHTQTQSAVDERLKPEANASDIILKRDYSEQVRRISAELNELPINPYFSKWKISGFKYDKVVLHRIYFTLFKQHLEMPVG